MFLKKIKRNKKLLVLIFLIFVFLIGLSFVLGLWDLLIRGVVGCGIGAWATSSGACDSFSPPKIGNCDSCNNKPLQRCTEYQCRNIGKNCKFNLDPNLDDVGKCIKIDISDISGPSIESCSILLMENEKLEFFEYKNPSLCEVKDVSSEGAIIEITTNEPAICKIGEKIDMDYANEQNIIIDNNYVLKHYIPILPPMDSFEELKAECGKGNCKYYIKCSDYNENVKRGDAFLLRYTLGKSVGDSSPPFMLLDSAVIANGVTLALGQNAVDFNVEVFDKTGVSGCKYSRDEDKPYDEMKEVFNCESGALVKCNANLIGLKDGEDNIFYFRCKDSVSPAPNVDQQGVKFILKGGIALSVSSNIIDGARILRGESFSVSTSGGNYKGESICSFYENSKLLLKEKDGGVAHNFDLNLFKENGLHSIKIECEDYDGNKAEDEINVDIESVDLSVTHYSSSPNVKGQDVSIVVVTSGGDNNGQANCKLFKKSSANYIDENGVASNLVEDEKKKHIFNLKEKNGNYKWYVSCRDLTERNENGVEVSFDINTPELNMIINPKSGTIQGLSVAVTIETSGGIDGKGSSFCKYTVPGVDFKEQWNENWDNIKTINGVLKGNKFIIKLPSEKGLFGKPSNRYYFVCKDDAGKSKGEIVDYGVALEAYNLVFDEFKIDNNINLVTTEINPVLSFITKNGYHKNGQAECDIECGQNSDRRSWDIVSSALENGYKHLVRFNNLMDGRYICNIICDDDFDREIVQQAQIGFDVNTPDLNINIISPQGDVEKRDLRLIIDTSGGVNNNGEASCYYIKNLVDKFEVNNIVDITRVEGISYYYRAMKIINPYPVAGNKYTHIKVISGEVKTGENTLYIQCKDKVGKLAPSAGPERVVFNVIS